MSRQVTRSLHDLVIGSRPTRRIQLRRNNAAVNVTGYAFQGRLQVSEGDATPLLTVAGAIVAPATDGKIDFAFPALTEVNTGGRDDQRLFRVYIWTDGNTANPPHEVLDFGVAVK